MENPIEPSPIPFAIPKAFPSDFETPRELEHPLYSLRDVQADTLIWIQPQLLRPAYELWAGERVVATLRYRGRMRPGAMAVSADGLWMFEESKLHQPGVEIYQQKRRVGRLQQLESLRGVLSLEDGTCYHWIRSGLWRKEWAILDEAGRMLMQFTPEASAQARLRVNLAAGAAEAPHTSLLALMGKYVALAHDTPLEVV